MLSPAVVQAATSFSFNVSEGQGGLSNEFYHGRCVRVDVMLDTDGENTGGADLEINYDNSRIAIVNNNCSTAATTIYHDSQYDAYTNNTVTASKITLGSYNNPGNIHNGSGRFASFYFTVLDGLGNYDLDFEFTLGDTTDTNLAEFGTGNEILDQADSYTLSFADDNDTPHVNNLNPNSGAVGIQVISNIQFRLNDNSTGIDISTLDIDLTGANWGTTSYTEASGQVLYSCHTTNTNRVDYCDITINPTNNLYYCETNTVDITVSDLGNPTVHTLSNYTYDFDTELDNDAPTLYNLSPADGSGGNSNVTDIDFNIQDVAVPGTYPGAGVDVSTLIVDVSALVWGSQTYTTVSPELSSTPISVNDYGNVYDYDISINPSTDFPENTLVTVRVRSNDYGCTSINSMDYTYTFTTADTVAPVCDQFSPNQSAVDLGLSEDITFRCIDDGVGVDINSMEVIVSGAVYTAGGANQFSYTGNSAEYFITVNPDNDFFDNYALETIINVEDFSNNQISQISYGLATGTNCSSDDGTGGGSTGGGKRYICKDPEALNYSGDQFAEHNQSLCAYCSDCESTDPVVVTEYKTCEIIKNYNSINLLSAGSNISNTLIEGISLDRINDNLNEVDGILITVSEDLLILEGRSISNTTVSLMIESDPIIITGLTDGDGKWRIEMVNIFTNGIHKISAISLSDDNYVVNTKHLGDFIVKRGKFNWWCWLMLLLLTIISVASYSRYRNIKEKLIKNKKKDLKIKKPS